VTCRADGTRSNSPDGPAAWKETTLMVEHRPNEDRHQWMRTALALARFVLWLGWLVWTLTDRGATR
jgi:hypothetical protein